MNSGGFFTISPVFGFQRSTLNAQLNNGAGCADMEIGGIFHFGFPYLTTSLSHLRAVASGTNISEAEASAPLFFFLCPFDSWTRPEGRASRFKDFNSKLPTLNS
ncbi:MAG: hypothetical protein HRF49_11530 [bacterium]